MDNTVSQENTFHAGICMAGAISAGAYTAGVIDYLIEVLEHWEKAKKLQDAGKLEGVPRHNFVIEVLGGASAGGMTAAITAAATQESFEPIHRKDENNPAITEKNPLYNCWVNLKETDGMDMMDLMLSTDDIEMDGLLNSSKEVRAAFNSTFIKDIADFALDVRVKSKYNRPYIATDLDVFTTITNLRGFSYNVKFETTTGVREHRMKMHNDYAFFKLSDQDDDNRSQSPTQDLNTTFLSKEISENDGRIPINFNAPNGLNTEILKQAAMSTGAFPIGLESRDLSRDRAYIEKNKYLNLLLAGQAANQNNVSYEFLPDEKYLSLNVDGGLINNEPFEITQQLLDDRRRNTCSDENEAIQYSPKTSSTDFDSFVLMIDPFPNDNEPEPANFIIKKAWKNVVPSIISAMRGQLMMKGDQIKRAYLSDDYTRFLISPVRTHNCIVQSYSIASGSLGGFGGFFSKQFRKHDFYLGRRNCQKFLQHHLTVPEKADNPILKFGYESLSNYGYISNNVKYLPIIPDFRVDGNEVVGFKIVPALEEKEYPYPKIKLSYILGLRNKLKKRIKCILDNVQNVADDKSPLTLAWKSEILPRIRKKSWLKRNFDKLIKNNLIKVYIFLGKLSAKGAIADACIDAIIIDMEKRSLIEEDSSSSNKV
ncbi:putative acylesterase/phospholipase RssA [Pedobacter sp. CAN_A7]|uniref:patatin-like phospholipase family protein n=1 Tax=Pedobacter sp. CAN_A7 TaxID=2787722 RepID=UPI0018CB29F4